MTIIATMLPLPVDELEIGLRHGRCRYPRTSLAISTDALKRTDGARFTVYEVGSADVDALLMQAQMIVASSTPAVHERQQA